MDIIELPDFDVMMGLIDEIYELSLRRSELKAFISVTEAELNLTARTDSNYFIDGKPLPQTTVDSIYKYKGLSGELVPVRSELDVVESKINLAKNKLEYYRMLVDVWRTQAANERTLAN